MSIGSRYKDEIDSFCGETYKVSGEEMLQMAKRNSINITGNTTSAKKKIARRAVLIPVAAALFGISAVTAAAGAAGYGPLSGLSNTFVKYFGDETTKKLADEGYIYTAEDYAADSKAETESTAKAYPVMGETAVKDGFAVRINGIAGDTQSPQMLVDITVEDEKVAAASDMLGLYTLTLGAEEFDKNRENYFIEYCKAVKDETVPNLYHASVYCPPVWVTSGEEVVADIISIHTTEDNTGGVHEYYRDAELADRGVNNIELGEHGGLVSVNPDADMSVISGYNYYNKITEHNLDMQFRFTIPENVFKQSAVLYYDEEEFIYKLGEAPYRLCDAEFGEHDSWVTLACDLAEGFTSEDMVSGSDEVFAAAHDTAAKFTLSVDGKEYRPEIEKTGLYCDTEGDRSLCIKDKCYISLYFPVIKYAEARSIVLTAEDTSYDLKAVKSCKNDAAMVTPSEAAADTQNDESASVPDPETEETVS